jgi:dTMP kinase
LSLFITFEGGEGCGKTTQSRLLARRLKLLAMPSVMLREPGGSRLGESIRRLLKNRAAVAISPAAELLLFNASRSQLVSEVILPALGDGRIVVCDRFADSTLAYQGYGRGLDVNSVKELNRFATGGLRPDLVFLLDLDPREGLGRKARETADRFESENLAFHRRVREGFLQLARSESDRWTVLDAAAPRDAIASLVWSRVIAALDNLNRRERGSGG